MRKQVYCIALRGASAVVWTGVSGSLAFVEEIPVASC